MAGHGHRPTEAQCLGYLSSGVNATADPDIAGTGVITAFLVSAYLTFALVLFGYVSGLVEDELLGPVDRRFCGIMSRFHQHPIYSAVLRKAVLTLSDQQIVTGIAVMGAAFQGLRTGEISVYHYQIALYLAWLSSSVHLSALTLLRPYLERHPMVKLWRLIGMGVLLFLLIVGLIPTVSYDWGIVNPYDPENIPDYLLGPTGWGIPAICFWGETYGDGVNNDAPIAYILLVIGYWWKMGDFLPERSWMRSSIVGWPFRKLFDSTLTWIFRAFQRKRQTWTLWVYRIMFAFYLPWIVILEVCDSFTASLWLSVLGLIFGTIQIVLPRDQNAPMVGQQENAIGFGQLVPLVLLVLPLGAVTEEARRSGQVVFTHENLSMHDLSKVAGQEILAVRQKSMWRPSGFMEHMFVEFPQQTRDVIRVDALRAAMAPFRTYAILILALQLAVLAGALLVFINDAWNIGVARGGNWVVVALTAAGYFGTSWIVLAVCATARFVRPRKMRVVHTGSSD